MFSRSIASNILRQASRPAALLRAARVAPTARTAASPPPFLFPSSSSSPPSPSPFRLQARFLSDETRSAIDKAVASAQVVLFMKGTPETPQCGFSRAVIQILGAQGVDPNKFAAFNVLEDDGLRQGIKEYSDWPTIPQLYVNKDFVGGCDILVSMHQNGELAKLFEDHGVLADEADEADEKAK